MWRHHFHWAYCLKLVLSFVVDGQTDSSKGQSAHCMSAVTVLESPASQFLLFLFYTREVIKPISPKHLRVCEHILPLLLKWLSWLTPCSLREAITYCLLIKSSYKYPLSVSPWSWLKSMGNPRKTMSQMFLKIQRAEPTLKMMKWEATY